MASVENQPWSSILPLFVGVLENATAPESAREQVRAQLALMAALADEALSNARSEGRDTGSMLPRIGDPDVPAARG